MVQWSLGYNKVKKSGRIPNGSIGILIMNKLAHHALSPVSNHLGLGFWCWARIKEQSKSAHSYYFALLPLQVRWTYDHLSTTGAYVIKVTTQCVPKRKDVLNDLAKEIKDWQQEGGGIILLMDLNDDVRDKETTWLLWELGLE